MCLIDFRCNQNRRNATGKRSASQSNIPTGALLSKPAEVISEGVGESIPATDQATVQQSAGSYQEEKEIVIDDETIREYVFILFYRCL